MPLDTIADWPDSIEITPDPASLNDQSTLNLAVTAHYLDARPDIDVTPYVIWENTDETVVTVEGAEWNNFLYYNQAHPGLAHGVTPGTATVTATLVAYYLTLTTDPDIRLEDSVGVTVTAAPPLPDPAGGDGRFLVAFDQPTLTVDPVWTRLDDQPNLVTSYTIDRGRVYELDRIDTGRATVEIIDPDGILDPTNPGGPYYGQIQPLIQATIGRRNPVTGEWTTRYRGFVADYDYQVDPTQRFNRLTVSLVDLFELLTAAEMHTGEFGHASAERSRGQVVYNSQGVTGRIHDVLRDYGLPARFHAILPPADPIDHVYLQETVYSPGEAVLTAIQEAADGEFPALAAVFCDRRGRLTYRDRLAKFFPADRAADVGPAMWDYHEWKAGDGAAVNLSIGDTAQVREFGFQRGLSKIINSASATPAGIQDEDVIGQLVVDTVSVGLYGIRSWSADGLLTRGSGYGLEDNLAETRRFALYYTANYATPRDRITSIGFRPLRPDDPRAPALYEFLGLVDISDSITITVATATGGFESAEYFVEGIHEDVRPLVPEYDDTTLRLDLSPRAFYSTNPWPD